MSLLIVILAAPSPAHSSFYNIYGLGARATAMGGAYAALANDSSAVFYNPAALLEAGQYRSDMGISRNFYNLDISLDGNYWQEKLARMGLTSDDEIEAIFQDELVEILYINMGMAMALWKDTSKRPLFSMGFLFNAPYSPWFNRFFFQAPSDPIFLEYTNYPNKFSILFGTGLDVSGILDEKFDIEIPGVSLGFGLNTFFLGVGTLEMMPTYMGIELPWDFGPIIGVLIKPFKGFYSDVLESVKLGITHNWGMNLVFDFEQINLLGMTGRIGAPDSFSIGVSRFSVSVDPVKNLSVSYELDKVLWSEFRPPFWAGEGQINDLMAEDFEFEPFNDIWVNRIGAEYRMLPTALKLRGGYFFRPNAVPDQTGYTNFMDCDTHVFSLGIGYEVIEGISIGLYAQNRIMKKRTMDKVSSEDPALTGTITGSGDAWFTGLELNMGR